MTSKSKDWIDEVLEDEPCTLIQMGIIESLLVTSSASSKYININIETLTYEEAGEIIKDLRNNNIPRDCKDQLKEMFDKGVFK